MDYVYIFVSYSHFKDVFPYHIHTFKDVFLYCAAFQYGTCQIPFSIIRKICHKKNQSQPFD